MQENKYNNKKLAVDNLDSFFLFLFLLSNVDKDHNTQKWQQGNANNYQQNRQGGFNNSNQSNQPFQRQSQMQYNQHHNRSNSRYQPYPHNQQQQSSQQQQQQQRFGNSSNYKSNTGNPGFNRNNQSNRGGYWR